MTGENEFTPEELAELGETDETDAGELNTDDQDDQNDDQSSDDDQDQSDQDDEQGQDDQDDQNQDQSDDEDKENRVPQADFDKLYGKSKEAERKLELLRDDPEKYYTEFPDEKKSDAATKQTTDPNDPQNLTVRGGEYDGQTLAEIQAVNPTHAIFLYNKHIKEQNQVEQDNKRKLQKSQNEVESFSDILAGRMFDGKSMKDLDTKSAKAVEDDILKLITFMKETGRGAGILSDAHYLMNRDTEIINARKEGVKDLTNSLNKDTVKSISSTKSGSTKGGYDSYLAMTNQEMTTKMNDMGEKEYMKFIKDAPPDLKRKHPGIDWDD